MVAYDEFERFLDDQRRRLTVAESEALARGRRNFVGLAHDCKAASFIWTAAALERFLPSFIAESVAAINSRSLPASDLAMHLFAMACEPEFHQVRSADPRAAYAARLQILGLVASPAPTVLQGDGPIDGRTIRAYHFEAVWETFRLGGDPWPGLVHRQVIEDLAERRNEVAHGERSPIDLGRTRTFDDCLKMLARVEEVVLHAVIAMDDYLTKERFRR